jgi:hypothetical protein
MTSPWTPWRDHFSANARRPLPRVTAPELPAEQARTLLASLKVFQLGETGEGRIVHQIRRHHLHGVDETYGEALALFVAEEGRHAQILGRLVRAMGGAPLRHNWTHRLFEGGRGLAGVRTKLMVLLAAEVIAVGFYGALASRLPPGAAADALEQILADEAQHLEFHADFFRVQTPTRTRRAAFRAAWWPLVTAACAAVTADHLATLRAFDVSADELLRRCLAPARAAEDAVLGEHPLRQTALRAAR